MDYITHKKTKNLESKELRLPSGHSNNTNTSHTANNYTASSYPVMLVTHLNGSFASIGVSFRKFSFIVLLLLPLFKIA